MTLSFTILSFSPLTCYISLIPGSPLRAITHDSPQLPLYFAAMHAITASSAARKRPMSGSAHPVCDIIHPPSKQWTSPYRLHSVLISLLATPRALPVEKHGKPHHPFPRTLAPYPVNYEKAVLDAYVFYKLPSTMLIDILTVMR